MLNNKGYTLIEALMVISIVVIVSSLLIANHQYKVNDEVILQQIKHSLYETKLNSLVYKNYTDLSFQSSSLMISSMFMNKEYDFRYTKFENTHYSYNEEGHINEGGHIDFKINNHSYRLKFHLGSGYFEIE